MAEDLIIIEGKKAVVYQGVIPQIKALIGNETDRIANLANTVAALKETFSFFWVGFYLAQENELVLAPFQGPVACTRIQRGKGVCGTCWENKETIIVDDVNAFPGHIACSSLSKSEIVVPLLKDGEVIGILDVDSEHHAHFDSIDAHYLTEICSWLVTVL